MARLVHLITLVDDAEQRTAIKNALGIIEKREATLELRRNVLVARTRWSRKTVERRENAGFKDLAHIIIEHSATTEEQADDDAPVVSDTQRIEDLEQVVASLTRLLYSLLRDKDSTAAFMRSLREDWFAYQLSLAKMMHRVSRSADDVTGLLIGLEEADEYLLRQLANAKAPSGELSREIDTSWAFESHTPLQSEALEQIEEVELSETPDRP